MTIYESRDNSIHLGPLPTSTFALVAWKIESSKVGLAQAFRSFTFHVLTGDRLVSFVHLKKISKIMRIGFFSFVSKKQGRFLRRVIVLE